MTETVLYDAAEGIATVTLNRPDRMNAIGDDLHDRLLLALERAASDDDVAVVILTGAGRGFCPGADMEMLRTERPPAEAEPMATRIRNGRQWMRISELLHGMPKITIAAVNGACAGAGFSMALACDLRFAARRAVFRTAFVAVGASGDYGMNWLLPRIVGWGKARELLFLNEKLSAEQAHALGIVARVVDDEQLLPEVRAVAETLVSVPRPGLVAIKQNLLDAEATSLSEELDLESERIIRTLGSPEAKAAARAWQSGPRPSGS